MNSDSMFITSRRRYKVLLRELEVKGPGSVDPLVVTELELLEKKFPELKEIRVHTRSREGAARTQTSSYQQVTNLTESASSLDVSKKGETAKCRTMLSQIRDKVESHVLGESCKEDVLISQPRRQVKASFLVISLILGLCNAFHKRSLFDPMKYIKLLVCSVLNAVLHVFVCSPCSTIGMHIMPSLFCFMIHLNNLYTLYFHERTRLSFSMLLVYCFFDIIPSFVATFVFYLLTLSVLDVAQAVNLESQCNRLQVQ